MPPMHTITIISIALTFCYSGTAVLKSLLEAGFDCFTFLYCVHFKVPFKNKNTAVKSLRRNGLSMFDMKKLTDYSLGVI